MGFATIFLIAVSLAMDAFAVSISNGIAVKNFSLKNGIVVAAYFGAFQFFMPVIGWMLGLSVKSYIEAFDHWIAFGLLLIIGGNMIKEALSNEDDKTEGASSAEAFLSGKRLVFQAIATSIDALAVGISFAVLEVNIWFSSAVIGIVAFVISLFGGCLGKRLGLMFKDKAELFGGVILIGIGAKILMEHIFF